jgi:cyclophilin family peptidyl-prolyl cis-trans isomerase
MGSRLCIDLKRGFCYLDFSSESPHPEEVIVAKNLLSFLLILSIAIVLPGLDQKSGANPKVLIKTSKGDITVELYPEKAPVTVKNFLSYVDEKFYDGTIFHRIKKGFVIQGGGLTPDYVEKPQKPPIKNEAANKLHNLKGTIAMARSEDIDSATAQFYINHKDNWGLDHQDDTVDGFGYCVFGKVIAGMDVVDAIARVQTGIVHDYEDAPLQTIRIISIRRI